VAWVISGGTNNTGKCGLGQTPKARKAFGAVLPGGSKLNQRREGTFLWKKHVLAEEGGDTKNVERAASCQAKPANASSAPDVL
jgi:hypothetical protein